MNLILDRCHDLWVKGSDNRLVFEEGVVGSVQGDGPLRATRLGPGSLRRCPGPRVLGNK